MNCEQNRDTRKEPVENEGILFDFLRFGGVIQFRRWTDYDERTGAINDGEWTNIVHLLQHDLHVYIRHQVEALPLQQDVRY